MIPIGFGIIGSGNIARLQAQALQTIPGVRFEGFCGKTPERAASLANEFGVNWETQLDRFLNAPQIQAVSICTPSGTHADIGIQAARAGKHVLVEKPVDVTREKAVALIQACRTARVRLGVIFQSRFLPAVKFLKKNLDAGRLGHILAAEASVKWYRSPEYFLAASWRGTLSLDGGGALINQAIHTIDLLQYLAGPVSSVFGIAKRQIHAIEAEDTAAALVQFEEGALGVIQGTTSIYPGFSRRVEIHGENGSAILDGNDLTCWKLKAGGDQDSELEALRGKDTSDGSSNPMTLEITGHQHQIEDFLAAIHEDRDPVVSGEEGLKALEIVLAIYRSSREGRLVWLEEIRQP
jgi:UDP-N-acetyl-2-amino-2-deoxyglucuronate dehydrogenase